MRTPTQPFIALVLIEITCCTVLLHATEGKAQRSPDYLILVKAYADAMIKHGQDTYGQVHSPLFAEELDRSTLRMLEGESLKQVAGITREAWGIRTHDRMLGGANPQHCQNLYQILHQLTETSGQAHYAEQANRSLRFFLEHCQSPATGLYWWGEHAGWDLRTDKPLEKGAGDTHEFYRPWILWRRCWQLAPQACERFARGLWLHQIGNHETGDFSRHAAIATHGPGTEAPYARHGGFYIETWAIAYQHTRDEVFLTAIRVVLEGLERARLHEGGMLASGSKRSGGRTPYSVSLAISLEIAAQHVPLDLAKKLRNVAESNDRAFAQAQRTAPGQIRGDWSNAYGSGGPPASANACMLRYRQRPTDAYRDFILRTAQAYRDALVDLRRPVWPGTVGNVILLQLNAYELSSEEKYIQAGHRFAHRGVELFLTDDCPLPRASHAHQHYEAVTNGDTLMMALLRLWLAQERAGVEHSLIFTDR